MEKNLPYSRVWLESLSNGELIKLADDLGLDIPYGLERNFIIEELLLESAGLCERQTKDDLQETPSYIEPVHLPKQYNITFIEVIIRDPLWAYVFWEIKNHDRETHEHSSDFGGYCLRVIPLNKDNENETNETLKEKSFMVSITADDSARYIGFAEHSPKVTGRYVIMLAAIRGDSEIQLALSPPFILPRLIEDGNFFDNEGCGSIEKNPLVSLSGVQEFITVKNSDHQLRVKRQ